MEDAITYYALAVQIKPTWGAPYEQLGYAYLNKADYAKAKENFAKFLEVEPNSEKAPTVQAILDQLKKMK
jgi:Tfp pilus assembly protein PilF